MIAYAANCKIRYVRAVMGGKLRDKKGVEETINKIHKAIDTIHVSSINEG